MMIMTRLIRRWWPPALVVGFTIVWAATSVEMARGAVFAQSGGVTSPLSLAGSTATPTPVFTDVPSDYWAREYIEILYSEGYVAGCQSSPLMYCPERVLNRAESAVFVMRGAYGAIPDPPYPPPGTPTFDDVDPAYWGYGWIESMWTDGFTAGCGTDPLIYCPLRDHTRAEGSVFFLRVKNSAAYNPPPPAGIFADVSLAAWYAGWVEAAYSEGLLPPCQTNPLKFCPDDTLDRSWAAYMMVWAKGGFGLPAPTLVPTSTATPDPTPTDTPEPNANVLVGAGDIADCGSFKDEQTATLLDNIAGTVFTTGDNVYPDGTDQEFADCYDPTWGRHRARTRPSPGNRDYQTTDATGYFNYFGSAAGEIGKGYYSYDVGDWHIIALNSECSDIGGCDISSPQGQWLQADLAANPSTCTLAYWHKPRFSSVNNLSAVQPFWELLYAAEADVVLNGHAHVYERFAPQDPTGIADPGRGIREFIVGTGGAGLGSFRIPVPNSEVREISTYGVLKLSLHPTSYDWEFIPIAGQTFTDSGTADCISS